MGNKRLTGNLYEKTETNHLKSKEDHLTWIK